MKLKSFIATGLVAVILAIPAHAQELSDESQSFIEKAAISNMFEIRSSKVALDRTEVQTVRDFAQDMIEDHSKAEEDLKSAISSADLDVQVPQTLDETHHDKMNELQETDAEDFAEEYIDMQLEAHEEAISLFEDYAENGENPELREFATKTLPTLRKHKERVEQLEEDIEG